MDMVITNIQQQRQVTEQLRREAAIKRITVSKAVEDIMKYITEHEQEDCLLVGFSSQKSNPFREKIIIILIHFFCNVLRSVSFSSISDWKMLF
ncbi:Guanine nucleotide-binding protein subunit gamma-1 [Cotesia glomerata]|uniref:Guanine nucleotide-binding protein subunit gamma-1 n=1 Tax=Cotesia glomerata TaxID=32391 RepID=A0AAV7IS05_COTGL|nr:Guanine nucleotide-binding protein subunit gamma-1 [Cotesia glomerata]